MARAALGEAGARVSGTGGMGIMHGRWAWALGVGGDCADASLGRGLQAMAPASVQASAQASASVNVRRAACGVRRAS